MAISTTIGLSLPWLGRAKQIRCCRLVDAGIVASCETPVPDAWQHFLSSLAPELAAQHQNPPDDVLELAGGRTIGVDEIFVLLVEQLMTPIRIGPRAVRSDRSSAAHLAGSWRHNVFRQVRAVVVLRKVGLLNEARPNARMCLEHAIALRRLALAADEGRLEPLMEEIAYQAQQRQLDELKHLEELDRASGGLNQHLVSGGRMSRVSWNFGGGPVSIRLRSPGDHCIRW